MIEKEEQDNKVINWLKKLGLVGFLFFLGKGIVWLVLFYMAGKNWDSVFG